MKLENNIHYTQLVNKKMSIQFNSDLKWASFLLKTPNNNIFGLQ